MHEAREGDGRPWWGRKANITRGTSAEQPGKLGKLKLRAEVQALEQERASWGEGRGGVRGGDRGTAAGLSGLGTEWRVTVCSGGGCAGDGPLGLSRVREERCPSFLRPPRGTRKG